jgi:hypothetical protein
LSVWRVQPLVAFVDGAVVGAAQQHEVLQVGGPPCSQWRRWWASHQAGGRSQPGNTQPPSRTTSAVRWAGETARVARPTSSGWVAGPPRPGGSTASAAWRRSASPPAAPVSDPGWWWPWWLSPQSAAWPSRWSRVTSTRVTAASQASRRAVSTGSGPTQPPSPPGSPGCWPSRLASSTVMVTCGRTPPLLGSRPPARARRASSVSASARRCDPLRSSSALAGRASGSSAVSRVSPASGSSSPSMATIPARVADSHSRAAGAAAGRARRRRRGRRRPAGG